MSIAGDSVFACLCFRDLIQEAKMLTEKSDMATTTTGTFKTTGHHRPFTTDRRQLISVTNDRTCAAGVELVDLAVAKHVAKIKSDQVFQPAVSIYRSKHSCYGCVCRNVEVSPKLIAHKAHVIGTPNQNFCFVLLRVRQGLHLWQRLQLRNPGR